MLKIFRSSAGFVALIIVGLVVVAGSTATAARLITGKDIKNGTITSKDIKNGTVKGKDIKRGTIREKQLSKAVKSKLNAGVPRGDAPGGFVVKDGDGTAVDGFVSAIPFVRVWDGGLWYYLWDGTLLVSGGFVYEDVNCQGTPFAFDNYGPQWRRVSDSGQGYRLAGTPAQSKTLKSWDGLGSCDNYPIPETDDVFDVVAVDAPQPLKGPLTVHANP